MYSEVRSGKNTDNPHGGDGRNRRSGVQMPLILPESLVKVWICPDTKPEDLFGNALTYMVFEKVVEG